ncbi:MAG TPA: indolepyruvate oxidoreductase subunit beta family protein, partial [Xanthobacteraceae bacterium]|nr:indolepyruvate oxidoreductase subunit beta family protein [Xanthobacteraceae bacterium]
MSERPLSLLIAALGGEGGGVLTDWIVAAAQACDLPVQSTSIPGVAQRTGATTYYIEVYPVSHAQLAGKRPVLALSPGVGDVDMVVASELLEAGRQIAAGFVTAERTLLIASVSRVYLTTEKMQMGDGRYDSQRLIDAAVANSRAAVLFDMEAAARSAGTIVNSVMLGAIAASGRLPIPVEAFEAAIRQDGKAVESNLRGFAAGLAVVRDKALPATRQPGKRAANPTRAALEAEAAALPEAARATAIEGVRRLAAYQDLDYARLYLDRLKPFGEPKLLAEIARHLAVRMS